MKPKVSAKSGPPRRPATTADKREELKTYRELTLGRELKSIRQRRRIEANGLRRVLGNGSTTQPYIVVETRRYREVRIEVQRRLLREAQKMDLQLPVDLLLEQLHSRIEAGTYALLAEEINLASSSHIPMAALGRALTKEERARFAASHAASEMEASPRRATGERRRRSTRCSAPSRSGRSTTRRATRRSGRRWSAPMWRSSRISTRSIRRRRPPFSVASIRCSHRISNAAGVSREKLGKALGLPIRQLRAKF